LVDFSYQRKVVKEMLGKAESITFLDHHESAIADLAGLSEEENCGNFWDKSDVTRSGAALAWIHVAGSDSNMPHILRAIEDRDLWKFEIPKTREITAYMASQPYYFRLWDEICDDNLNEIVIPTGKILLEVRDKQIAEIVSAAAPCGIYIHDKFYEVNIANCPRDLRSEVGEALIRGNAFSITYFDNATHRSYSLRSIADHAGGFDVSEAAKLLGRGGGHRNAAGFTVPIKNDIYRMPIVYTGIVRSVND
jgi:oligoribonuclease NrnB/cAMP/cGMP phosphodiesterase (DHH superfamily)